MSAPQSAGLLLYRRGTRGLEVFLVHPGGPFWARKDAGAWSIPKGEFAAGSDPLAAARREFQEETGGAPEGVFTPLVPVKQRGGKTVHAWMIEGDFDPARLVSNTFELEWPARSGVRREYPEVDRGGWFTLAEARIKLSPAQCAFVDQLERLLAPASPGLPLVAGGTE